jgi:hypothetical protein
VAPSLTPLSNFQESDCFLFILVDFPRRFALRLHKLLDESSFGSDESGFTVDESGLTLITSWTGPVKE